MTWAGTYTNVTYLGATDWLIGETNGGAGFAFHATALCYKDSSGTYRIGGPVTATGKANVVGLSSTGYSIAGSGVHLGLNSTVGNITCYNLGGPAYLDLVLNAATHTFQIQGVSKIVIAAASITPAADNSISCGSASFRFSVIYAGTGTINTSDERDKQQIGAIADNLLDAWAAVEWQRFKFNDAVAAKGDAARWHFGAIAQQVRDVIDSALGEGEAVRLGLCCFDEWEATEAVPATEEIRDEEGNILSLAMPEQLAREAGNGWGLRYDECFAVEAAYQRRRMDRIEARLTALGG